MTELTPAQKQAIDPKATIWVTASAGSGKTKVLTDRLLTLLLSGTAPERLLCLTFTKAAAAEMANRLQERLSAWVVASDDLLAQELKHLGFEGNPAQKTRARRLFSVLLDTPGGFKIQTLHGFCQSLLGRFPLEAGISPHCTVLDDAEASQLLRRAQDDVFRQAQTEDVPFLKPAVRRLTASFSEITIRSLLEEAVLELGRSAWLDSQASGLSETIEKRLAHFFQMETASLFIRNQDVLRAELYGAFDATALRYVVDCLEASLTPDATQAAHHQAQLLRVCLGDFPPHVDAYQRLFLTQAGEPRKRLISANLSRSYPEVERLLLVEQQRVLACRDREKSHIAGEIAVALVRLSCGMQQRYDALKRQQALLDYDDLITATIRLLHSSQGALWVLYKLDNGLDHLLIDEAQDTNPAQWQVIRGLADAFFETPEAQKTLFIVGDPKQSIYSFQGASPLAFSLMQDHVKTRLADLQKPFRAVVLEQSFRSSPVILEAVDRVFRSGSFLEGVDDKALRHTAFRKNLPGQVEIWPLLDGAQSKHIAQENQEGASLPHAYMRAPETLLAEGIAEKIQGWIESQSPLSQGPLRPGDVLILVRRRGRLMRALVKALKDRHIPVAGVDRMDLHDALSVLDVLKLGEFCLLPTDDLTLAVVLKGPLVRLSEDHLFELAHGRGERSLWSCLRKKAASDGAHWRVAYTFLAGLWQRSLTLTPFSFFADVLHRLGGRYLVMERLGLDVADALDEFLALCLTYEQHHGHTLQGFVCWMAQRRVTIKRNMETSGRDEVRILTVHGSKGLEAPVVILPDTVQTPSELPPLLWIDGQDHPPMPCMTPAEDQLPNCLVSSKQREVQKQEEEYNRLLYVALTRAKERLYVCGWKGERRVSEKSWYEGVREALLSHPDVVSFPFNSPRLQPRLQPYPQWQGEGLRLMRGGLRTADGMEGSEPGALSVDPLPAWIREPVPPEKTVDVVAVTAAQEGRDETGSSIAQRRGLLIHGLLERLIPLEDGDRLRKGQAYLDRQGIEPLLAEDLLKTVLTLLHKPDLQWLWEDGLNEVPLWGERGGRILSGRVDRLLIRPDKVMVVDFKTDAEPPEILPVAYQQQLEMYRDLLGPLYAQPLECGVLWTCSGHMTWLSTSKKK